MYILTKHASKRMKQRGIKKGVFEVFLKFADREAPVGSGDYAISLSKKQVSKLPGQGLERDVVDKVARLVVVCSTEGVIKTCMIAMKGKSRRYGVGNHDVQIRKTRQPYNDNLPLKSRQVGR